MKKPKNIQETSLLHLLANLLEDVLAKNTESLSSQVPGSSSEVQPIRLTAGASTALEHRT